jgi:hypothetical protein
MKMPSKTKRANDPNDYGGGGIESDLLERAEAEFQQLGAAFTIPLHLGIHAALSLAGTLQLAMRHPLLPDSSLVTARMMVDGIRDTFRAAGYTACAEMIDLGDQRESDIHVRH